MAHQALRHPSAGVAKPIRLDSTTQQMLISLIAPSAKVVLHYIAQAAKNHSQDAAAR